MSNITLYKTLFICNFNITSLLLSERCLSKNSATVARIDVRGKTSAFMVNKIKSTMENCSWTGETFLLFV